MEMETVDRIEHLARGFAVVLVALVGLQTLSGEIEGQMGPFATFAALACITDLLGVQVGVLLANGLQVEAQVDENLLGDHRRQESI